jgi:hypothetical protein
MTGLRTERARLKRPSRKMVEPPNGICCIAHSDGDDATSTTNLGRVGRNDNCLPADPAEVADVVDVAEIDRGLLVASHRDGRGEQMRRHLERASIQKLCPLSADLKLVRDLGALGEVMAYKINRDGFPRLWCT